jgi:CP family cyanate transporter-like MFS transporter
MMKETNTPLPSALYMIGFFLVAANLRAPITGVGPLADTIQQYFQISPSLIGLLNTTPLLIFGLLSPLAIFGQRIGIERMIFIALIILMTGILLRSQGSLSMLFTGSIVLSTGIAIGNVLLPALIKRDFSSYISQMSTAYSITFGLTAAIASGITVPLSIILTGQWRSALAIWAILAFIAIIFWLPNLKKHHSAIPIPSKLQSKKTAIWRSPIAWQVTGFMGLQSLTFYVTIGWFPTYLKSHDVSLSTSGWLLTLFQVISLFAGAAIPFIMKITKDQRMIAVFASLSSLIGILGIFFLPKLAIIWFAIGGIGSGISIILALMFISLRTSNHQQTTQLSIMAQSIGYLIAATGPFLFGLLFDIFNAWSASFAVFITLVVLQTILGCLAGRNRTI